MALLLAFVPAGAQAGRDGQMTHDSVLLGMHFLHERSDCNTPGPGAVNVAPSFRDYLEHMPEDLRHISYADFWHWWYEFERYKGDEKGLAEMDAIIEACLQRGMKVKIDLAWSTWWTHDKDWEKDANLVIGPGDLDDWAHLCDLLGRRYRGKVALWLLQGEANTRDYWPGCDIRHVQEVYRTGYRAFKRVDPGTFISISGATPGEGGINIYGAVNNRAEMDRWTRDNLAACKGCYDDVPMNYFADVKGADPYQGLQNYYRSIRTVLDGLGLHDVEVGSGESSFQWALDSYQVKSAPGPWKRDFDPNTQPPLSEEGQAWRCNEALGAFFDMGGNKFMCWGTEFAPGGGWAWRWGFRKYQDWWNLWPETHRVAGTNIVYRYDNPDGRTVDLRPGWTSAQADPYHPIWQVFTFWAQAAPPASEAVRLPARADSNGPRLLKLATYLRAQDRCVMLLQNDHPTPVSLRVDLKPTGWQDGAALTARIRNEEIHYITGARRVQWSKSLPAQVTRGQIQLSLPSLVGFTTLEIRRDRPAHDAACLRRQGPERGEVGRPLECLLVLRNTGTAPWPAKSVALTLCEPGARGRAWPLPADVPPGGMAAVPVRLSAATAPGYVTHSLRLREGRNRWFGPLFDLSFAVSDLDAPRKLVAFREVGHVRLKWFAPEHAGNGTAYEVYRADGFAQPARLLATVHGTDYVDEALSRDRAYYYHVVAVDQKGRRSRPSNEDNAKALSKPRVWDAEVIAHTVPAQMRRGETQTATLTLRNTGLRPWDLGRPKERRLFLNSTQQWGCMEEARLPKTDLGDGGFIAPGQTVTLHVPYAALREGRFENHWVLCMDLPGKDRVYFGTPLLVETVVTAR